MERVFVVVDNVRGEEREWRVIHRGIDRCSVPLARPPPDDDGGSATSSSAVVARGRMYGVAATSPPFVPHRGCTVWYDAIRDEGSNNIHLYHCHILAFSSFDDVHGDVSVLYPLFPSLLKAELDTTFILIVEHSFNQLSSFFCAFSQNYSAERLA
jgi:hypothetical protein